MWFLTMQQAAQQRRRYAVYIYAIVDSLPDGRIKRRPLAESFAF